MGSISDRLRALGVGAGLNGIKNKPAASPTTRSDNLDKLLPGQVVSNASGKFYLIETIYPDPYEHGKITLSESFPLDNLALCSGQQEIKEMKLQSFAFVDTETTGLSFGSGTFAFLIGVGRFIGNDFHLHQLLMRDPLDETAQLRQLEEILAKCEAVVTFNGKSFDLPLLQTRYNAYHWPNPFRDYPHVDLLQFARKLWSTRLQSRTLGSLEHHILEMLRTDEDIPGWAIPQIYFDFLNTGIATPLKRVIYHNAIDIVSLAALFSEISGILANPLEFDCKHSADYYSVGKLFEDNGDMAIAIPLYRTYINKYQQQPAEEDNYLLLTALMRLALIYKRAADYPSALPLWEKSTRHHHIPAYIELAKYYEHTEKDLNSARKWTTEAIEVISTPGESNLTINPSTSYWLPHLTHRLNRINRKIQSSSAE